MGPTLNIAVKDRISWFRLKYPKGKIVSDFQSYEGGLAIMQATIYDEEEHILARATGSAKYRDTDSFGQNPIECAETKAIGRALSFAGFGTQFSTDAELPKDEPVDMGVLVNKDNEDLTGNINNLFGGKSSEVKRNEFEEKVEKFKKTITPDDSKKVIITYGNMATLTFADVYRKADAGNKLGDIERYANPTDEELDNVKPNIVAAARVFLESAKK